MDHPKTKPDPDLVSPISPLRPVSSSSSSSGTGEPRRHSLSASSAVNSPPPSALPAGNICPSGKTLKTGMMSNRTTRTEVLGSGGVSYGHGSIMRSAAASRRSCGGAEDLKRAGNESYAKGDFAEALGFYDKAVALTPGNATLHFNRAAAFTGLRRLGEALRECEEAIRFNPGYVRAHRRLGSLFVRSVC